ncbi:MAG: hypothetical protein ACI9VN_002675, partial [Patescibacteria group bacterium]
KMMSGKAEVLMAGLVRVCFFRIIMDDFLVTATALRGCYDLFF